MLFKPSGTCDLEHRAYFLGGRPDILSLLRRPRRVTFLTSVRISRHSIRTALRPSFGRFLPTPRNHCCPGRMASGPHQAPLDAL